MARLEIECLGLTAGRQRDLRPMATHHHHQEVELNFVFGGGVTYLHHGAERHLPAGRLAAFWGAVPHTVVATEPRTDMAWITVPLVALRTWNLGDDFVGALLSGKWRLAPPGDADRFPVAAWVDELQAGGRAAARGVEWELRGCLHWLARHSDSLRARRTREREPGTKAVEAMACAIAGRHQEALTVTEVAAAAGLHPNYAMTLFRNRCGMTIRDYLARLRVMHAQRLLIEGGAKVADIAFECGFESLSAFYAEFRRQTGAAPGEYRRRSLGRHRDHV